jgi:gliding motility-associated-like protein
MNDLTYNLTINTIQALSNSKLYVDDQFYCTLNSTNKTVKLPIGISQLKFARSGYKDTLFTVSTTGTLNLSMTPYSYSSLTDSTIFNFNNRPNPQYWKTITVKNLSTFSDVRLLAKQYDDPFTGMSLKPLTRKFVFRRMNSDAAYYKTAIALDQVNTPDKDSVYLLSIKGDRYIKYLPNVTGVTEYDPEVQKVEFDKLDFTSNDTHEIVWMQKQRPAMKPMDTIWHSGQTLVFPIDMFVSDPDSIKNDITASSADVKVVVNGNLVYVTAPVNFVGTTSFTLTGTHDWLDETRTYTMKVIPPEAFIPTAFTPNNDGLNDILRPTFMGKLLYCHFMIFNRGGQKVFDTKDCLAGWNGKIQGAEQATGTYVYYLTYRFEGVNEKEKNAKGVFTLIK